jgi:hypothetical protein
VFLSMERLCKIWTEIFGHKFLFFKVLRKIFLREIFARFGHTFWGGGV